MGLKWAYNINDFRTAAKKRLPKLIFDFLDGGVLDEDTLAASVRDFRSIELRPTSLADARGLDLSTTVLGREISFPLMVSPMGILTMFHPKADVALAAEAKRMNTIFMHSSVSGVSLEDTASAISADRLWAQMAIRSDAENAAYLDRVRKLGIDTLILSADTVSADKRERDLRNGLLTMPPKPPLKGLVSFAMRPGWVYRWLTGPQFNFADYLIDGRPMKMKEMYQWMGYNGHEIDRHGWDGIRGIRDQWKGNIVVKGLSTPTDAVLAADAGADAVFISNMGARHFDGTPSTISSLPSIVEALRGAGSAAEVYLDGGIRRGQDIVRALALGATATGAGRAFGYALGGYGQKGVARVYDLLRDEFEIAMKGVGRTRVTDVDRSVIAYLPPNERYADEVAELQRERSAQPKAAA